jgi:DAK2 domain fusion protein YloV
MARRACDGNGLLDAFRAAVANLEAHVDEINGLNVYPVPDGDTGSNMFATVRAALEEADAVAGQPADRVAAAISFGALMGARGNSGVITSQIFRGMAEALGGKNRFNGLDLAHALTEGARTAYGAVAKPVEGTILTVIRESAAGAVEAAELNNDIESVLAATLAAAEKSVARTPSLLAILREAGVVDSGGQGLYRLFQGALLHLTGKAPVGAAQGGRRAAGPKPSTLVAHADEGFGYETMFLLRARGREPLDVDAIRDHLESIGGSVLVAGDARALKVHVHNERPDLVIGYGLGLGDLSRITVENLDNQAQDVRETRAAEFTGDPPPPPTEASIARLDRDAASGADGAADRNGTGAAKDLPSLAVIAVTAGDGLAAIFRDFGVASVVQGGQSANPSTGELLEAVGKVPAKEVLLLPNNPNVVLAARQVASMAERPVQVVPTRNAAEGFAALLALDPGMDAAGNVGPMTEAGRSIQSVVVTEAVRDATIGGKKVKRGQTIALDPDDGLVAVDNDRGKAVARAMTALTPGFELLTLFYGDGADLAEAEAMAKRIGTVIPGIEIEVRHGGQPYYRYLISAE